jgi:sulfate permease, SulP family
VLIGYMAGVALIMIAGQLGRITGVHVTGEEFISQLRSFASSAGGAQPVVLAVAAAVVAFLVLFRWRWPGIPGPLLAVLLATVQAVGP